LWHAAAFLDVFYGISLRGNFVMALFDDRIASGHERRILHSDRAGKRMFESPVDTDRYRE
jgi:hypothetical protein